MNDIEKDFVPYEQSLALKKLGFKKECLKWYTNANNLSDDHIFLQYSEDKEFAYAPTFSQAFRFFREKHDLDIIYRPHIGKTKEYICEPISIKLEAKNTFEEAELECLKKLIEIVKTN